MVNILVKYLKIKGLEQLIREGDLVKIFVVKYSREGTGRTFHKFAISNFALKFLGFFAQYQKFSFIFQRKFVEVLCIFEFLKNSLYRVSYYRENPTKKTSRESIKLYSDET